MSESTAGDGRDTATSDPTTADVIEVFKHHESPAITSRDVAIVLGCSRDVARRRLQTLAERGEVKRHKSGTVVLWWHPEYVDEPSTPPDLEPLETAEMDSVAVIEANPLPDSPE